MTVKDAASRLATMYANAARGEKLVQIHLFGIHYADELAGHSMTEVAMRAGIRKSLGTEINKGRNLARYVKLRVNSD